MDLDSGLVTWLLDTDPALRWQVERDLLAEPEEVWGRTRARVAVEGFGARLLAEQGADGQWDGGAFFPAGWLAKDPEGKLPQPWTATTWSLRSLREWGVEASALGDTAERIRANSRWEYDDLPYWEGEVDCCINAFTLASGTWLGADVSGIEAWFGEHQMADGGWNCAWEYDGSTRSSFHSTINTLEALLYRQTHGFDSPAIRELRHAGEEYLLERDLLDRRSTGEQVGDFVTQFVNPPRARYSALRALDHLRLASLTDGTSPDPRAERAVDLVREKQNADGTWTQEARLGGQVWVETDVPPGERSPWLTLQGLRVLRWWEEG